MERIHAARENGRGRLSLGEGRLNEPQSHQLDRRHKELDVAVEDEPFAKAMEAMYLDDLSHATEVVLIAQQRVGPGQQKPESPCKRELAH